MPLSSILKSILVAASDEAATKLCDEEPNRASEI
jgi:hypothetical protein